MEEGGEKFFRLGNRILVWGDFLKFKECMSLFIFSGCGVFQMVVLDWNFNNIEVN